jgi:hypothetical protein
MSDDRFFIVGQDVPEDTADEEGGKVCRGRRLSTGELEKSGGRKTYKAR